MNVAMNSPITIVGLDIRYALFGLMTVPSLGRAFDRLARLSIGQHLPHNRMAVAAIIISVVFPLTIWAAAAHPRVPAFLLASRYRTAYSALKKGK